MASYEEVENHLAPYGLALRGGVHVKDLDKESPEYPGDGVKTILLVGNIGSNIWPNFSETMTPHEHPLDVWSKHAIDKVAHLCNAKAIYPSDGPPYFPFQRWAMRAEAVFPSPVGVLIHHEYGLWHAYRGALFFAEEMTLPEKPDVTRPCDQCIDKPCLSACPVQAFSEDKGYAWERCFNHLKTEEGQAHCLSKGCQTRPPCPVGQDYAYVAEHAAFHIQAFYKGRLRAESP